MNRFRLITGTALFALILICAGSASAQTVANVTVYSGNGQYICKCYYSNSQWTIKPFVVRVTDANGAPVNQAQVSWAVTTPGFVSGSLLGDTTYSDANGLAQNTLLTNIAQGGYVEFQQFTVTATSNNIAAAFTLTQGLEEPPQTVSGSLYAPPPVTVRIPSDGRELYTGTTFTGQIGSTATPPIKIQVVTTRTNSPVPNVAVFLVNDQTPDVGSTLQCAAQPGAGRDTVLTDASGIATCTPVFGGKPNVANSGAFVDVGGAYDLDQTQPPSGFWVYPSGSGRLVINATPAAAGQFTSVSGNQQSAQAGQSLANPLIVQVASTTGSPLSGMAVNWTASPANAVAFGSTQTTTDSTGRTQNTVRFPASASGAVTITATLASDTTKTVTFTATALPNVTVTALQIVSGNNQAAVVGAAFGAPLVVQLSATGGTATGVAVAFTVSGPATLSSSSVNTDANGRAQVNVTAGATAGAVTVTATAAGISQTFNLTVSPPGPTLLTSSFLNAADLQPGALSPCSLATIIATGIAPGLTNMVSAPIPGLLPGVIANTSVSVGSINAPVLSVGRNANGQEQLTFQVPCDVNPGSSVPVTVNVGAGNKTLNIPIQAASPGVFQTVGTDGTARAVVIRPDGSYVTPQNPGRIGENLVALVTGLGAAAPPAGSNSVAAPGTTVIPQGTVVVGMAGVGIPLISAQLSPDLIGVWMVTFTVPTSISTGNATFSVSVIPAGSSAPISSGSAVIPISR